jgi:hypothetical protein
MAGAARQTLKGRWDAVSSVAFSPDGKVELTLSVSNDWIAEGKATILRLPPEYRATCEAVWNEIIALGHSLGGISILGFREGPKLI